MVCSWVQVNRNERRWINKRARAAQTASSALVPEGLVPAREERAVGSGVLNLAS
jgi:hypothetical protein